MFIVLKQLETALRAMENYIDKQNNNIDYETHIINRPKIESQEIIGNKTFEELGISSIEADDLLNILN